MIFRTQINVQRLIINRSIIHSLRVIYLFTLIDPLKKDARRENDFLHGEKE